LVAVGRGYPQHIHSHNEQKFNLKNRDLLCTNSQASFGFGTDVRIDGDDDIKRETRRAETAGFNSDCCVSSDGRDRQEAIFRDPLKTFHRLSLPAPDTNR
jgi:hypothetical protein